jgi:hypothetical protein
LQDQLYVARESTSNTVGSFCNVIRSQPGSWEGNASLRMEEE